MTENLIHRNKESQPNIRLVIQLEEARIGNHDRLESIKKTLSVGQELPEVDKQYLEEQVGQLQKTIDPQLMEEWKTTFFQKLKEKNASKIDKKLLEQTYAELKQATEKEKETKWTLDLISQLRETKVGDSSKLHYISKLLKNRKNIEENDKEYLNEKAKHLRQVVDCKTKVVWAQDTIRKLQENEKRHSKKLEEIKQSVENGRLVSEREQNYLNARYKKLQNALDEQNKIEWTIQTIQKLEEFRVGDSKKLVTIKELLEDEMPVSENEIKYLKEEYEFLRQTLKHKRKIDWTVEMIKELQEIEIGNHERLAVIKKDVEERKQIPEIEINYLTQKCRLLMITKKFEENETTNNKNQTEDSNYISILRELNNSIKELEKLQVTFLVA